MGDTSGKLYIYKNDDPKPWITRTCVGMVSNKRMKNNIITVVSCHDEHLFKCDVFSQLTCVGVGDVCNKGRVSKKYSGSSSIEYGTTEYNGIQPDCCGSHMVLEGHTSYLKKIIFMI